MTLRDDGLWLNDLWAAVARDVQIVFAENILEWPLWTVGVVAVLFLAITLPNLVTVKAEEASQPTKAGIWDSSWVALVAFCFISYVIFASFTGRHGLPAYLGFVGLISWPIIGYGLALRFKRRRKS